jgi:hypothetical protein
MNEEELGEGEQVGARGSRWGGHGGLNRVERRRSQQWQALGRRWDEVGEEERMRACIRGLLEDDAPKRVSPTPRTV